jgi:LPS-assembly protein
MGSERRSGFLTATAGVNSNSGIDVTTPYYLNIAPNRDLTIYPRYMSKRGEQLGGEYRYLESDYSGVLLAEYCPVMLFYNPVVGPIQFAINNWYLPA